MPYYLSEETLDQQLDTVKPSGDAEQQPPARIFKVRETIISALSHEIEKSDPAYGGFRVRAMEKLAKGDATFEYNSFKTLKDICAHKTHPMLWTALERVFDSVKPDGSPPAENSRTRPAMPVPDDEEPMSDTASSIRKEAEEAQVEARKKKKAPNKK